MLGFLKTAVITAIIGLCARAKAAGLEGSSVDQPKFLSAYFVASNHFGNALPAVDGFLTAAHADPHLLSAFGGTETKAIVDVQSFLYDFKTKTLRADIDAKLERLASLIEPHLGKIKAFYVNDEPYLNGFSRSLVESAIDRLKARFPGIPTYLTFGLFCFDPAWPEPTCSAAGVPPEERGIPANVDWVAFDYYSDGNCNGQRVVGLDANFSCHMEGGVRRLKALTTKPIMLVGETVDLFIKQESELIRLFEKTVDFAARDPQIIGIDLFLWPNVDNTREHFHGMANFPNLQKTVLDYGRRQLCGAEAGVCRP